MKNYFNKLGICSLIILLFAQVRVFSQAGVPPAPYCLAAYSQVPCNQPNPSNTPGNFINDFINSFNTTGGITNITNNNSGCNTQVLAGFGQVNYIYHGCQHYIQTVPGAVITCNMQSGTTWAQGFAVFVDWNNDGVFFNGAPEKVVTTAVPPANTFIAGNFTVPAAQPAGVYRMRVRCMWATNGTAITPCNAATYGEVEDYNIYVGTTPAGMITATATASSPLCSGTPLTLSVTTSASPTVAMTYTWTGPASFSNTTQSPTIATTSTLNSGVYTVICNPGACPVTKTVAVTVNPTPTITTVSNNGPICQGAALNLSVNANPTAVTSGTVAYSWTGPNGFTSNLASPSIASAMPVNTGTYSLTITNTFTNGGVCTNTGSTQAFVVPVASVALSPLTSTLCENSNFSLTANAASATSYSWTGPNGFTSTIPTPSLTNINPTNSGNYSVTAFFTTPGTTLVCQSTAVSNLSVVPRNPVSVTVTPNVCQHTQATIDANAVGAAGYSWTGPNNFSSSSATNTITTIQPVASGVYYVTAMFTIGSVSCTTSNSANLNVVPVSSITVNAPVSVCFPSNVSLQSSAAGALTYNWTGPNSYTANTNNTTILGPGLNASGIYTITTSYNNGILTCYNTNTTQVTVNPIITFTLPAYKQTCYNQPYIVNGPAGATSYTWVGSTGYTANTQDLNIPAILPNQSGTYTLNVQLGPCITSQSTKVEVLTPIQFTLTPNSRSICLGDSVKFTMGSTGGSQNYAYVWNPSVFIGSPTGSVAVGVPQGTTIYNIAGYDIACPNYTISHTFTVEVKQPPKPNIQLENFKGCQPLCLFLNTGTQQEAAITTFDFGGDLKFQGDSVMYCLNNPGTYQMKIYSKGTNGCSGVYEFPSPIEVYPTPHSDINFNPENPSTTNNHVTFVPSSQYGPVVSTEWMFQGASGAASYDTTSERSPLRIYDNVGKYPVTLVSKTDKGCVDTVFKVLDIRDEMTVYIPNSFTPNGDNLNDIFSVKGIGLKTEGYSMEIFDRWGSSIYFTKDILKGWDGTVKGAAVGEGVYIYKIKIIGANGEGRKEYIGHVTLLK